MLTPLGYWGQLGDPNEWVILRGLPFPEEKSAVTYSIYSSKLVPNKHNFNI